MTKLTRNKLTLEMVRKSLTKCESQSEIIHSSKAITKTSLDQTCDDLTVISTAQNKQKQTLTRSRSRVSPKKNRTDHYRRTLLIRYAKTNKDYQARANQHKTIKHTNYL